MTGLELVAVVLAAVRLMTWPARRLHLSGPLMLLGGGVLIGLTPHFDHGICPVYRVVHEVCHRVD
ncbi:hypothetical protein ACFVW5_07845 [Streptomyces sp. NPDC058232]|uniref:hypothetical protein n=1 Tax=unclassified Streptomyces TaxID=2593676 RepID=UPI0036E24F85